MIRRRFVFCLVLAVLPLAGCKQHPAISSHRTQSAAAPAGALGSLLPDFAVTDLYGNKISSAELRGKVVLVDVWATWCKPCEKEMPGFQKLQDRYGKDGLVVIGLKSNVMRDQEDPLRFAKRIGVHYPLVSAPDDLVRRFVKLEGLPTTMLYDRHGVLRKKVIGFEYTDVLEAAVRSLL